MFPAFLAAFLWSYCIVAARQSVEQLGENAANFWRLLVAVISLGAIAHLLGLGFGGGAFLYFALSGFVGFGLGDIGGFYALNRIGSRLTILMAQCVAAPIAGFVEWWWLGTPLSFLQILAVTVILSGITLALFPDPGDLTIRRWKSGLLFGLLAAAGQGVGAVLSRKAYLTAYAKGTWEENVGLPDALWMGATSGYQRLLGGIGVVAVFWLISRWYRPWKSFPNPTRQNDSKLSKVSFCLQNAAAGPIFGIICFQWALASHPSAVVQPIVAMTPLLVIPWAYWMEGDKPTKRSILGTLISIGGVILLASQ